MVVDSSYYENLEDRVGPIEEDVAVLKDLGILVDRDDKGYLLQIFTRPLTDRPTFFIEIIQSENSGNFVARDKIVLVRAWGILIW